MITLTIISLWTFMGVLLFDYLINQGFFGLFIKKIYFKFIFKSRFGFILLSLIIFVSILSVLMIISLFEIHILNEISLFNGSELFNNMADSSKVNGSDKSGIGSNASVIANTTATVNLPNLGLSFPASREGLNNIAAAASAAGGVTLALKAMQQMPGGQGAKAAAGQGAYILTQAVTAGMGKILNSGSNSGGGVSGSSSYTSNLIDNFSMLSSNMTDLYNTFPLNLLPEIDKLASAELLFLMVIFNVYAVQYLTTINYETKLPHNKLGNFLKIIISRYIKL